MYAETPCCRWFMLLGLAVYCTVSTVRGLPMISDDPVSSEIALDYLQKYNYLNTPEEGGDILTITDVRSTIRRMQEFANLPQTGEIDAATLEVMQMPRCGVPDPTGRSVNGTVLGGGLRLKRYAHTGGRWERADHTLTYRILNNPAEMSYNEVVDIIGQAFKLWSDVTPLRFYEITGSEYADIYMSFGPYDHGDPFPFDGPGGTLAHAFPPKSGFNDLDGDVHFDDSELFTSFTNNGVNLLQVAAHEIGHSLGLAHSNVVGALMQPFFPGYIPDYQLHYDDIVGIQTLYGSRPVGPDSNPQPTYKPDVAKTPTVVKPDKDTCNRAFQTMTYVRGEIFGFRGVLYWRIASAGQLISSPEGDRVKYFWQGLPGKINGGYERYHDQKILFFKGDQYWQYDGITLEDGYPRPISSLSPHLPIDIDAVMTWKEFSKTYFFKGNQVWRFDEATKTVDANWPYLIKDIFPGVPSNLGSAFRFRDGNGYFIRGRKYWRFNDTASKVDDGFPRYFGSDFLNCDLQMILEDEAKEEAAQDEPDNAGRALTVTAPIAAIGLFVSLMLAV